MTLSRIGYPVTSDITHGSVLTPSHQRTKKNSNFATAIGPPYYPITLEACVTSAKYLIYQHQMGLKTNLFKPEALLKKIDAQSTTCSNQMDSMAAQKRT